MSNKLAVQKISVEKLFGQYDYNLPHNSLIDINKLMIVYGDNGTGKTTILKLFFYLLSTREMSGYKSRIADIKFKKFSIHFQNGLEICAFREKTLIGSYEYYISKNGKKVRSVLLRADSQNTINIEPNSKDLVAYNSIIKYIRDLNINTFYLSDDRKMLNSSTSGLHEIDDNQRILIDDSNKVVARELRRYGSKRSFDEREIIIEPVIDRLIDWVRSKIITGSRKGEKNSQVIFSDIIKNYIILSDTESTVKDKDALLKELDGLELKIPSYVKLGLIDDLDTKTIRSSIKKAKTNEQIKFLSTVISPFLESINAKLIALEKVEGTLNLFIQTINDYFSNKEMLFNLTTGFVLKQKGGEKLMFNWLSSGEKQLLLLLVNTITAADEATIFIIDEPEISLNIKWQRKLIKTLLAFSNEKNIQFILATHSFELLSAYKNNITKLSDENA